MSKAKGVTFWEGTGGGKGLTVTSLEVQAVRLWADVQALGASVMEQADPTLRVIGQYMRTAAKGSDEEIVDALFLAKARSRDAGKEPMSAEPGMMTDAGSN